MAWSSYQELIVWQKAMDVTVEIYRLVKKLPKEELYELSSQMRRAAVSIPSNIAEWHARNSEKEFIHFLSMAQGSKSELETQLLLSVRVHYLSDSDIHHALMLLSETGRLLTALIQSLRNTLEARNKN